MPWLLDSLDQPRYGSECDTQPYTQILTQDGIKGRIWFWPIVSCKFYNKKVIPMYFMQIYFHVLWSGNKFTDFFCISEFFVDPTHNVNYKGKQNSENILKVKMIKVNLKANNLSLTICGNFLYFIFTKSR